MKAEIEIIKRSELTPYIPYIPEERMEELRSGDSICLGIRSKKGDEIYGAGIVSLVKTKGTEKASFLEMESVYIDPVYRKKGIFRSFITGLKKGVKQRGLSGILTETV
ncbi:MAG: hypothetical protein J5966_09000, partial [Lachnospiraceae bacterium]|nr:hypothetical protein [Lachnospiraceae bacterium]